MLNLSKMSNEKLIDKLAVLNIDFMKPGNNYKILEYEELKNELQKRIFFGNNYAEKNELLGSAVFVSQKYFDDKLDKISDEADELHIGYMEFTNIEDLEEDYPFSDIITDGERIAVLEWS